MATTPGSPDGRAPHLIYLAIGFPPAAKSSAYRLRETANQFRKQGWDVTVVTIQSEAWEREFGLDHSLSDQVEPGIEIVELPLIREDFETDIRKFSEGRALRPAAWITELRKREVREFPEPVFGAWRRALEEAVVAIHRRHPADLALATCAPYVNFAAVWKLWKTHTVPYAIDFRDGWSLDVVNGGESFPVDSPAGEWERKVLDKAMSVWVVNDPIAGFYADRHPHIASRMHVVRNGYDADSVPLLEHKPDPDGGLTFGYLGTLNFSARVLERVLDGWRAARAIDPLLARSRFEVRGHLGAGAEREANAAAELLRSAAVDGVEFGGPVRKADVASTYAGWDAMVLILVGGRYVTSGKVYEYMASGLPIMSVHEVEHDATRVLTGHPLWIPPGPMDEATIADAFIRTARMALEASDADRAAVRAHVDPFTREHLMTEAVQRLAEEALAASRAGAGRVA